MFLPILLNVNKNKITVIGGGKIALRKTMKILEYGGTVTCISPEFEEGFQDLSQAECIRTPYHKQLLTSGLVIAATNNRELNESIQKDCQQLGILCALVDNGVASDFIFSASEQTDDVIISVSTKGKNPALAKKILQDIMLQYESNEGNREAFNGICKEKNNED